MIDIEKEVENVFAKHIHDPARFTLMQQPIISLCQRIRTEENNKGFTVGFIEGKEAVIKQEREKAGELVERLQDRSEGCACGVNLNDCEECNKDKKVISAYLSAYESTPDGGGK